MVHFINTNNIFIVYIDRNNVSNIRYTKGYFIVTTSPGLPYVSLTSEGHTMVHPRPTPNARQKPHANSHLWLRSFNLQFYHYMVTRMSTQRHWQRRLTKLTSFWLHRATPPYLPHTLRPRKRPQRIGRETELWPRTINECICSDEVPALTVYFLVLWHYCRFRTRCITGYGPCVSNGNRITNVISCAPSVVSKSHEISSIYPSLHGELLLSMRGKPADVDTQTHAVLGIHNSGLAPMWMEQMI